MKFAICLLMLGVLAQVGLNAAAPRPYGDDNLDAEPNPGWTTDVTPIDSNESSAPPAGSTCGCGPGCSCNADGPSTDCNCKVACNCGANTPVTLPPTPEASCGCGASCACGANNSAKNCGCKKPCGCGKNRTDPSIQSLLDLLRELLNSLRY